jgi:hypothetical protein
LKRETRLNLIFLVVFLAISLPGAVILFIKKLDPAAPRMDEPDAVLRQVPFMTPPPAPSGARWMVPTQTRAWLDTLTRQKTGKAMASAVVGGPEWEPIISADHRMQVMSITPASNAAVAGLLLWNGATSTDISEYQLYAHLGLRVEKGAVESVEPVPVPPDVRKELVSLGYTHPPTQVLWMRAHWPGGLANGQTMQLDLTGWSEPPLRTSVEWAVK